MPMMSSHAQEAENPNQRRGKRLRKDSSSEFSIEELFPDDMGYDADNEALRPDGYEEVDSDIEQSHTPKRKFFSVDEELAARMKHLGSERSGTDSPLTPSTTRGRKRRSLHEEILHSKLGRSSDLEVTEVLERARSNPSPPKKRLRRSMRRSSSSQQAKEKRDRESTHGIDRLDSATDAMDVT